MSSAKKLIIADEKCVYHVTSRSVLDGLPINSEDKHFFVNLIRQLGEVFFVDVYGFCIMSTHFHLLFEMIPEKFISDDEIEIRFKNKYGLDREFNDEDIQFYRRKWSSLSEFIKELRQLFSRYYNKKYNRKGTFWSGKYKSLILEKGEAVLSCLVYIDLNPVRAGIVKNPADYEWSSLGMRLKKSGHKRDFLSFNIGIKELSIKNKKKARHRYLEYLVKVAALRFTNSHVEKMLEDPEKYEKLHKIDLKQIRRFRKQHRYFIDSGVLGNKAYVSSVYNRFKSYFNTDIEKKPKKISGIDGIYSMKRLSE